MLKDVDPDRSGQITFEEFVTLMNRAKGTQARRPDRAPAQ